ncbi:MAG: 50S ribosomal protein L18, partial [Woeseiaceae bacterium]
MKLDKKQNRLRRARRGRSKIRELEATRLSIHRTPRHIYAQVIGGAENKVLAAASSLEAEVRKGIKNGGTVEAAAIVGAR